MSGPNYEHYKKLYGDRWGPHAEVTTKLKVRIESEFPGVAVQVEHGADSSEKIKFKPEKKEQPDLILHYNYEKFGYIHVSVPATEMGPGKDIWVLEIKFKNAPTDKRVWYYFVYRNIVLVLDNDFVGRYANKATTFRPRGVPERYIPIPYDDLDPIDDFKESVLFDWIKNETNQ